MTTDEAPDAFLVLEICDKVLRRASSEFQGAVREQTGMTGDPLTFAFTAFEKLAQELSCCDAAQAVHYITAIADMIEARALGDEQAFAAANKRREQAIPHLVEGAARLGQRTPPAGTGS